MKNAMKKIMGLLLVAVLLVSVVPFQALADEMDLAAMDNIDGGAASISEDVTDKEIDLDEEQPEPAKAPVAQNNAIAPQADATYTVKVTVKTKSGNLAQNDYTENAGQNSTARDYLSAMVALKGINLDDYAGVEKYWVKNADTSKDGLTVNENYVVTKDTTLNIVLTEKEATTPAVPAVAPIKVVVKVNSSDNVVKEFEKTPSNGKSAKVGDLLTYGWNKDWDDVYTFDHAWNHTKSEEVTKTQSVEAGDTLYIMLKTKSTSNNSNNSSNNSSDNTTTNKFPYKVYLHVYLNNNIGEPDRNINITNTLATDGVVSMSEVKNLIPEYYKAKNSNGIGYDGLYLAKGNWVKDYVTDANKYTKMTNVDVRQGVEYVHINVMITNATAKTSSTADTSNPKTGDAIFMTITVMGLSAAALTGLYFYDRKRKVL